MDWKMAQFSLVHQLPYHVEISEPHWFNRSVNGPWSSGRYEGVTEWSYGGREGQIAPGNIWWFGPDLAPKMEAEPRSFHLPRTKFNKVLNFVPTWTIDEPGEEGLEKEYNCPVAPITLEAVEYLTFDASTGAGRSSCGPALNQFLVFHVRIRDCTSSQLEALSTLLSRPRSDLLNNRIRRHATDNSSLQSDCTSKKNYVEPLLDDLADIANRLLGFHTSRSPGTHQGTLKMAPGGYLTLEGGSKANIGFNPPPPSRSVVAIPVDPENLPAPRIFAADNAKEWGVTNQRAWALAAGAQKNTTGVPRCTGKTLQRFRADDLLHWSVLTAGGSIGVVRKTPTDIPSAESAVSCNPLNRAATRYVDIIMFNMRAYSVLTALGNRMSDLDIQLAADRDRYRRELDVLHTTQVDFAKIRDRLHAVFIPRRPTATQILLNTRRESGLQQLFDSTADAIQNRSEILTTIYRQLDSDHRDYEEKRRHEEETQQRLSRVLEEREREQRKNEQEKSKDVREENRHRQNNILAGAGLLIGAPGILDMIGVSKGAVGFLSLVGLYALGILAIVLYNHKTKSGGQPELTPTGQWETYSAAESQLSTSEQAAVRS